MSTVKTSYDTTTSITITLASLANTAARESTAVDNTTNLYLDVEVYLAIKVGTVSGTKAVNVYVAGSADGTNYTDNATGADAGITLSSPTNLRLIAVIATPTSSSTYKYVIGSVAQAFGGLLPPKWSIVVENQTGAALDSTEGNHTKSYRGAWATVV
jgi:hypothetical protein